MDNSDIEFITEMFLDTDATATLNRLVLAIANVVVENSENVEEVSDLLSNEHSRAIKELETVPVVPKRKKFSNDESLLNFTEEDYLEKYCMKKSTVMALINYLQDFIKPGSTVIPLEKKVLVFLCVLTSNSSYGDIGYNFGIHKSSVSYIFHEIAALLAEQRYNFITWPSMEEQHITRIKVNSRFRFPNCVGFIDVCKFKVGRKSNREEQYLLLQGVCDDNFSFIDIHIGDVGISKKNKLFRESLLAQELKNFVELDNHILGDTEYKLKKNLITPFSSEEILTHEEMKFNEIHWKARNYIGQTFEILKERFKKLNHIDINKIDDVKNLLYAACVLHNFVLLHEGAPQVKEELMLCEDVVTIDPNIVKSAEDKRQFLCNYINTMDAT